MPAPDHISVLLDEAVASLAIAPGDTVVDATYGRGGHAARIVELIGEKGRLLVMDRDPEAVAHARERFGDCPRVEVVHAAFSGIGDVLESRGLDGRVDAILFDLGVSSPQLDRAERGFSFNRDGPLDMRMDPASGIPASDWLAQTEEQEIVRVLKVYGEERFARRIARRIKQALAEDGVPTTARLVSLVKEAVPVVDRHKHPATRTFQAIRIAVNQELREIELALPAALDALAPGGRMVVISFHSLEDRIVKRFFRDQAKGDPYPSDLPVTADMLNPRLTLVGKPVRPGEKELDANPRARSAVMRVARKVA